jgi:class 3 adenylate cyclase/YHS domain-containing protein
MTEPPSAGGVREIDLTLLIANLSGYTALADTHGALQASETVLLFGRLVEASLEPGVAIIDRIGDEVFCAGADALAVVRSALRLRDKAEREPKFPRVRMGIHRGPIVEREGRLFGAPINLTARLAANASGGQIPCTEAIAGTARVFADVEPRPIGERRFRNLAHPVAVVELARTDERRASVVIDPVCRMRVAIDRAAETIANGGATYRFCSTECARAFAQAPGLYAGSGGH